MTQATSTKPVSESKTCANCPFFQDFNESNGRGWCELNDSYCRKHHEMTNDCILNGALDTNTAVISHKLEDNLQFFSKVEFEESKAFPTEQIIDEADLPRSEYQVGSIIKIIDSEEDYQEWGCFEVVEVRQNIQLYAALKEQIVVAAPSEQTALAGWKLEASHDWNALRSHAESYLNGSP